MDISKWFYRPHHTTPELDKKIIDDLSKNRIEKLRVIRENREAENAILSKLLIPPLCGDESRAEETESEGTQHDADGSSTEDKRTE